MFKINHTAPPFSLIHGNEIVDGGGSEVGSKPEDAEFIVLACNEYYSTLELLEKCSWHMYNPFEPDNQSDLYWRIKDKIDRRNNPYVIKHTKNNNAEAVK